MYHYVTDKVFLKESYSMCADLVNQLVQELKKYGIYSRMSVVGSKKRGMVVQNEKEPIDYDFNLWIDRVDNTEINGNLRKLKEYIKEVFDIVLEYNGQKSCNDSTSVLTTKKMQLKRENRTQFSIDVCIVKTDNYGNWYRLKHQKTWNVLLDTYYWEKGRYTTKNIEQKEKFLKPKYWLEVREIYLEKKNRYLRRQEMEYHPSYNCYIEAVNEVYDKVTLRNRTFWR